MPELYWAGTRAFSFYLRSRRMSQREGIIAITVFFFLAWTYLVHLVVLEIFKTRNAFYFQHYSLVLVFIHLFSTDRHSKQITKNISGVFFCTSHLKKKKNKNSVLYIICHLRGMDENKKKMRTKLERLRGFLSTVKYASPRHRIWINDDTQFNFVSLIPWWCMLSNKIAFG